MAQSKLEKTGLLTAVQRFSLNDGPGIRTTVFFKGCNLKCAWCHNPETISFDNELMVYPERCIGCGHCVEVCPVGAHFRAGAGVRFDRNRCVVCGKCAEICFPGAMSMAAREWTVDQTMAEIRQDIDYYRDSGGGVTLSGGEAFCQFKFADALTDACRAEGIPVAVETNLNWEFEAIRPVLAKMSLVMFDVKLADAEEHRHWTGVDNGRILANLGKLDSLGIPLIARTPLIPGATDTRENISAIVRQIAPLRNLVRYELLNFNPLGASKYRALHQDDCFTQVHPLDKDRLATLVAIASTSGIAVMVG